MNTLFFILLLTIIILAFVTLLIVFSIAWDDMTVKKRRTVLWIYLFISLLIFGSMAIDVFRFPCEPNKKRLIAYFVSLAIILSNFFRLYFKKVPAEHPTEETEKQ